MNVARAHIQDYGHASSLEHHWGYADRVLPCTNDAGSCEYLDVVYHSHDLGLIYSGIFWLTIAGVLLSWGGGRLLFRKAKGNENGVVGGTGIASEETAKRPNSISRLSTALVAASRHYLLPEVRMRPAIAVFGHTTRLQLLVLAILVGYLSIWSFVGIVYKTWITPVKNTPGLYNQRSSLGPWADRLGVLAYALTPLSILLCSRESLLSAITGIPYQSFLFLHRWVGYLVVVQSVLHTLGWCVIEGNFYKPQPSIWQSFVVQKYIVWGFVALVLLLLLFLFTLPPIFRLLGGYEFFRKAHYVLAMVYIGAAIGHWQQLQCFLVPGIAMWGIDRGLRLLRTVILHFRGRCNNNGSNANPQTGLFFFAATPADVTFFPDAADGDVVRLDFRQSGHAPWDIGKHFYLCFTEGRIWQSHPFTPLNDPTYDGEEGSVTEGKSNSENEKKPHTVTHSYIFRAKGGETKRIADMVATRLAETSAPATSTPVVLTGPYGRSIMSSITDDTNVLCIAGGTGITFVLPVLLRLARSTGAGNIASTNRKLRLVWAVRRRTALSWISDELQRLERNAGAHNLQVDIHVTADMEDTETSIHSGKDGEPSSSSPSMTRLSEKGSTYDTTVDEPARIISSGRPDLSVLVSNFAASTISGPTAVVASGPASMITSLRRAVATANVGAKVWRGDGRFDVRLIVDDRIE